MRRYPILLVLVILSLFSMVACQNVKEATSKGTKAVKAVKKAVEAAKTSDNPLKNAKVGDFLEFKTVTEAMGTKTETQTKQTVVAKDDVSITLRTEISMMGMKVPPQESKIMLNQPYEPYKAGNTDAVVTPLGEGDETITAGGKSYACHWAKVKVVVSKPSPITSTTTVWSSKEIPVTGVAKMITDSSMEVQGKTMDSRMVMELISAGQQ